MYQVEKIYGLIEIGGDKKLIPKDEIGEFLRKIRELEVSIDNYITMTPMEDKDDDYLFELRAELNNFVDSYSTLEGELVYVVLPQDIKE